MLKPTVFGHQGMRWSRSLIRKKFKIMILRCFLKDHPLLITDALHPQDAFYVGQTYQTFSYYEAKDKVKITCLDVRSLYPFISRYEKFPIGFPKVYIGDDCKRLTGNNHDLTNAEGLIKCRAFPLFVGLFVEYMNWFFKRKHEASGYPTYCTDEASKKAFIQHILESEGIPLVPENIK